MRKPYVKNIGSISKFKIWYVDGNYIRKNLSEEFTNFGQHYRFRFIPKNELWIDNEHSKKEKNFFIDHLLVENRLMSEGKSYEEALAKADRVEQKERKKLNMIKKAEKLKQKEILIKKIHKKLLKNYSQRIKVWIVKGELVRSIFFIDFTEGGHDYVYNFVPRGEIWLDDDCSPKELKYILLHELHERRLMSKGLPYEKAHRDSSRVEYFCRHNPKKLMQFLKKEINSVSL